MADDDATTGETGSDDNANAGKAEWAPPASQAEFDRIIADRITRERIKFSDYGDLKAKAAAHDKALEDAKTEQERAVDAARKEGAQSVAEKANARLIGAEARALAAEAKFRDPKDAVAFLDLSSIKVGDDGDVDGDALKSALKTLAESKPYLLADDKPGRPKPDAAQGTGSHGKATGVEAGRERFAASRGSTTPT